MNSTIHLLMYVSSNHFHYLNDIGTNLYKQELFVMAIRTPTERTFPGNFTIIPSSKKWVFHAIFWYAFLSLYGEFICSLNRLVVTDEEDARLPIPAGILRIPVFSAPVALFSQESRFLFRRNFFGTSSGNLSVWGLRRKIRRISFC
jgi:hypothetical protein